MKKITFLLLHLGLGGIETSIVNTANCLCNDLEVELVSFYKFPNNHKIDPKVKVKYLYDGVPNRDEFMHALKRFNIVGIFKEGIKATKILHLRKKLIIDEIKNSNSDYIVSTRIEFSTLLDKYGKKETVKIVQEHIHHNWNKALIKKLSSFKNIDYLFSLTQSLKEDYDKFLSWNKHIKICVVPNMIDMQEASSDLKSKNIITISRLTTIKRVNELIDIFSKLDNRKNKLYVIGAGPEAENLKKQVNEMGLADRVILTGYKTKEEMIPYMMDSSVFALTSTREGLPMVLLEAMSYGIPCIAYKTESGIIDIIDNDINGYYIENRDEALYIDTLNKMLKDSKKLQKLGVGAKEKAKKFSKEEVRKIWLNILK